MTAGGQVDDGSNGVTFSEYLLAAAAGPQDASVTVSPIAGIAIVQATFRAP
jgi:hypothetical protein